MNELPECPAALFPGRAERDRIDAWLTRDLADAVERTAAGSVVPTLDMARFRAELAGFDFGAPRDLEAVMRWVNTQLEHGVVHLTHPRYFGLFNPAPNFPSQCADRISGAFNPQLASSGSSPVPVDIEAHVVRALAARAGLPAEAAGHFTTNGSEANYTALICALTRAHPRFGEEGVRAFPGPVAMYTSRECQPAWFKIVHQAGMGRSWLRLIDTDGSGRLDARQLAQVLAQDRAAGVTPVLISPTAGTTGGGMVDPLRECAALAREYGAWFHVDAAWGGAALCSGRLRGLLDGIEAADSVTIDAHKWFATTMGCGMFITVHPQVLREAFRVTAGFMPSSATNDPYITTMQWSRRFMGLRLFLSLAAAGWAGYGQHVERAVAVIERVRQGLAERGWQILNGSRLAVLCTVPPRGSIAIPELVKRVVASGRAWVALGNFERRECVRICNTHAGTTDADVRELIAALESAARGD